MDNAKTPYGHGGHTMKNVMLRVSGLLLISASIVLFFWSTIEETQTERVNNKIIDAYTEGHETVKFTKLDEIITGVEPTAKADTPFNIQKDMAGIINIPSADITEPIYYGNLTEEKLRNGVSFINSTDSLDMQNIPIAGHRVEGAGIRFNYLDRVSTGEPIEIITNEQTRHYTITEIFDVPPSQVDVLAQNEGQTQELTLITCDGYEPETGLFERRMIVKAELSHIEGNHAI